MRSLTIHNIDDALDRAIRRRAINEDRSLNQTVKRLLQQAMTQENRKQLQKADFRDLLGTMSQAEGKRLLRRIEKNTEQIDPRDWE